MEISCADQYSPHDFLLSIGQEIKEHEGTEVKDGTNNQEDDVSEVDKKSNPPHQQTQAIEDLETTDL